MIRSFPRVPIRWVIAGLAGAPAVALAFVFWQASRAASEARTAVISRSEIAFRQATVHRTAPTDADLISAAADFEDMAAFQDRVFISTRACLFVYDRAGTLLQSYRSGFELPSGELGALATGILAGESQPELFIGTRRQGVLAFDGSQFRQLLPNDAALRNITSVLVLKSGRLLLGTEKHGLLIYDGRKLSSFNDQLQGMRITALAGDEGDLWIGTLANGVFHDHAGQSEAMKDDLPDPQVLSIATADGAAYVGTPLGVVEFRDGRRNRTLADGFFARALALNGATLHVGTEDEGIVDVPLESRGVARVRPESTTVFGGVRHLAVFDGIAYAVARNAVYRFDESGRVWKRAVQESPSVLADGNIAALGVSGGQLWVGYFDHGLDVVDPQFDRARHIENDAVFCINRIVADTGHSRTAVATANGLVLFDSGAEQRQVIGRKDGLLADHVTDVAMRAGGMVVATPGGLSFLDNSGVRSLYVFHGLVNNHVYTVATFGKATMAGTLGGISVLDDEAVRANLTTANSHLRHNWVTAIVRVDDGWFVGTYGGGILQLDKNGEWHTFPDLKSAFAVNPNAMLTTAQRVYAGTLDSGLMVYDRASARWTNATGGLPSLNVTALAEYGGSIYAGTDNGLVRFTRGQVQ
jgi:ligand-binding sensor domain-containing protein